MVLAPILEPWFQWPGTSPVPAMAMQEGGRQAGSFLVEPGARSVGKHHARLRRAKREREASGVWLHGSRRHRL